MQRIALGFLIVFVTLSAGCSTPWQTEINTVRPVSGLDVTVSDAGGQLWRVRAKNNTGDPALLVWDASSRVSTTGQSARLVRGQTRIIHSGQPQPASPIPGGAELNELFLPETSTGSVASAKFPGDPDKLARIILIFDIQGRKHIYEASVRFFQTKSR